MSQIQPITVSDLIKYLQTLPQHSLVAYRVYSEQQLLELDEIEVVEMCLPRADGWVQNKRPDMPSTEYVLFPGN